MGYKGDEIAQRLKAAREAQGLSQRALAERSGLAQSHISQIESGSTEPGLSTLVDLARALDLEVMLIPRKRVAAVSSLASPQPRLPSRLDPHARREIERGEAIIAAITKDVGSTASLDQITEALSFFKRSLLTARDVEILGSVFDALKRQQQTENASRRIREHAETLWALRNRLAHNRPALPRAAYALDDEDADDG